jgi:hypothetical protein
MRERWRALQNPFDSPHLAPTLGMFVALAYGVSGELFFKQNNWSDVLMGTLSISFLFLVPFGIGALTVTLSPQERRVSWPYAIFAPWAVCTLLGGVVMIFAMEAAICVAMGLPIFFVCSSVGGALVYWWQQRKAGDDRNLLGIILILPVLFSPVEARWQPPTTTREIHAAAVVDVPAAVIWDSFVAVPRIQPEEERFAWFRAAGLPHPVEAILVNPGAKGVRYASYDNGMRVIEPVQVWELHQRYRFGVQLDPTTGQHTPLWSDVAGEHLQVLWVEYRLKPISPTQTRVYLTSRYALQTPINTYSALWVDFLLSDFQQYILDIVTARATQQA